MKEKKGYKRRLIKTTWDRWSEETFRTWEYTWSDGSRELKTTRTKPW